ncbi:putative dehydrogenase [Sinorhizobium terangae]|uniref:Gfo/Idh/MocA family oxidoreductase n=1 Tax=Sinorhizobium terangae TaxID=110322 RepID=A0A6N7LFA9_SINTE|nr:Gfo/Idh/MocA family oxidoreductase [Sinorhizobium terangae]MBB4184615.1 putative dehydrogenase [Sinorhizobium terangae]MQX16487.1 gfo/Idh/MocA family oxidoreductase [Sinorhizobium terangae]
MSDATPLATTRNAVSRPRVGFLGVGRIGLHRMRAIVDTGAVETAAIFDPSPEMAAAARELTPEASVVSSFETLLDQQLEGIVIASPSALHAAQSIVALEQGVAVFCQKPLGRTRDEAAAVVDAARRVDRLLDVDLSYRHTDGMQQIRDLIASGELGTVFAADLTFHNAYGPSKPWFYDKALSGGGCVIDLGVHLVDLLLWALEFPEIVRVESRLFAKGSRIRRDGDDVEDYAVATLELANGIVARLACSWHLQAGCDAVITADFHGTGGGASFRNVNGSFLDFSAERYRGTQREVLTLPPDAWGGRAAAAWAKRLAAGERFDPDNDRLVAVADVLDRIYGR